ncbi:MAG TPA: alpha/beta hydrolase [Rhodoblastus sp.]|nr:alpha/beta hydrolase [Rhodoblastus sp.]
MRIARRSRLTTLTAALLFFAAPVIAHSLASSTEIEAPGPLGPLKGALAGPADAGSPAVLIIPGSGPTDRDGDNPLGVKAATYALLAAALAARGVTSVRIDKRGMFGSAAAVADANDVTIEDYAQDVGAWAETIRSRTGASCVWLLGHSEGGLVAMAAAARRPAHVCGLALVATAGRRLGDVLKEQLRANPANAPLLAAADAAIDALAAGRRVDAARLHPALAPLFRPAVQRFLVSAFALDPADLIARVDRPVLILQGGRDIQVGLADAARLKGACPSAMLTILPDVNHVLKRVTSDDRGANLATYADPNLPLAPGVVEAIAAFVGAPPRP